MEAGLSGAASPRWGGGGLIATRFSEDNRFTDALGVNGEGGVGDRKVVLTTPTTRGMSYPRAITVCGVGRKRDGIGPGGLTLVPGVPWGGRAFLHLGHIPWSGSRPVQVGGCSISSGSPSIISAKGCGSSSTSGSGADTQADT